MPCPFLRPIVKVNRHEMKFFICSDLRCLYQLLKQVDNGLKTICTCISNHLREEGKTLVAEENRNDIAVDPVQASQIILFWFFTLVILQILSEKKRFIIQNI